MMNDIPKEFPYRHPKGTFKGVKLYLESTESLKTFLQVCGMVLSFETLYQHIIYIRFHIFPQLMLEKLVHQSLVSGTCVPQPKRHDLVTVDRFASDERRLLLVLRVQRDLVVSLKDI